MHRDIKPENILLDADGNVVLADFGHAYDFSSGDMTHGPFGTHGYRSPQVFARLAYSSKTDVYSLGCIMQLMLYGSVSFSRACLSCTVLMQWFQLPSDRDVPRRNYKANDLIHSVRTAMLPDLYQHTDALMQMLEVDERRRPTAEELKQHSFFEFVYVTFAFSFADLRADALFPSDWKRVEERARTPALHYAPPVLVPDSDAVVSKSALLSGACSAVASTGSSAARLLVPKVVRPQVQQEQYCIKMDVRRGGARAQVLARAWSPLHGSRAFARCNPWRAFALSGSILVESVKEVPPPLDTTTTTSEPSTPPPATPPPRAPTPPAPIVKSWSPLLNAVPSYSHCFM